MKLYHGTSDEVGLKALKEGLKPRIAHGKSNWKHSIESHPSLIYLTTVYAGYFAMQAISTDCDLDRAKIALVEVDLEKIEKSNLRPDEDLIGRALMLGAAAGRLAEDCSPDWDLLQFTKYARERIDLWSHLWPKSLDTLGTLAHFGHIPKEAISRVSFVSLGKAKFAAINLLQPTITPANYRLKKPYYGLLTKWLMGEKVTGREMFVADNLIDPANLPGSARMIASLDAALSDQSGIEVLTVA